MVYNRFSFILILRLVFILVNLVLLVMVFTVLSEENLLFSSIVLFLLLVIQITGLIRQITITNRELAKFINAIHNSDDSASFPVRFQNKSFRELVGALNNSIQYIKNIKIEGEAKLQYLQILVENMDIGIVTLDHSGEISLLNHAAREILEIPNLSRWRSVRQKHESFDREINRLKGFGRSLIEIETRDGSKQLSVIVSSIILLKENFKIITFQDIKTEIERKETEAWHKLIRILNHEIMNSVTPLSSLTDTILLVLEDRSENQKSPTEISEQNISDIRTCVHTIKKRSENLMTFVEEYRKLTRIPQPTLKRISVPELLYTIRNLLAGEIERNKIALDLICDEKDLTIEADEKMLEQVLINLMNNSIYFLSGVSCPKIQISAFSREESVVIQVVDNGPGIADEELNKIFIPFYSSKKEGTGIGLSLSKHIMHMHNGDLQVKSTPNSETCFSLLFSSVSEIQRRS